MSNGDLMEGVTVVSETTGRGSQKRIVERTILDDLRGAGPEDFLADGRRRCKVTAKSTGNRCGRPAIDGGLVCRIHGGGAPQVKRKAALRLLELVDPAIATVARIMTDNTAPHAARLRAAENVLDRAGVPRTVDVTDSEAAKALLIERLIALRQAGQQPTPAAHDVVLGTVVPQEDSEPDETEDEEYQ